jgi:pyruvate kinase
VPGARQPRAKALRMAVVWSPLACSFIRKVLDEAGGQHIRIISKIESTAGLENYDGILAESDGIMVARGDLAMEIPSEKARRRPQRGGQRLPYDPRTDCVCR